MTERPKVRIPVEQVPWASGTVADLECWRRIHGPDLWPNEAREYFQNCCRWPKSCSAFDPGFTVGKGPTTLPVVWFDGFGWRSGPPKLKTVPDHLLGGIWRRWIATANERNLKIDPRDYWTFGPGSLPMTSPEEASDDDDHDGGEERGCGEACRRT